MEATRRPALLAWSGGKDAAWTLHVLRPSAAFEVVALLSTISQDDQRSSLQGVHRTVLQAQAKAAGLPLIEVELAAGCSNSEYEAAMAGALKAAAMRWPGLNTIAYGDLFLDDVRDWRRKSLRSIDWQLLTPLFGSDTQSLARQMTAAGLRASVCCVDTSQLAVGFIGRDFDDELLAELPTSVDHCSENGEFHTCVWDGPMFDHPIQLVLGKEEADHGARFARADFRLVRQSD